MTDLSELDLAMLKTAAGDTDQLEAILESAGKRMEDAGFLVKMSGAVGAGWELTDAGKAYLAAHKGGS